MNSEDRSVIMEISGIKKKGMFLIECYKGPLFSNVVDVKSKEISLKDFKKFRDKILMKIFLRHTSLDVKPDIFYGQTDLDVSSLRGRGEGNKKKITEVINEKNKIKIYSSPLKRCFKLAKKFQIT